MAEIQVHWIDPNDTVSYIIRASNGKSLTIKSSKKAKGEGQYWIRGHRGKVWRYPSYAIEKAISILKRSGHNVTITSGVAMVHHSYQVENIQYARGMVLSGGRVTESSPKERKAKTKPKSSAPRKMKAINIRGKIYKHHKTCSSKREAAAEKSKLQNKGFTVLVRGLHVYAGPKRKTKKR